MARKRVEAEATEPAAVTASKTSMVRGKDGSAFAHCEECKKDVPVALISFHSCSLDAKIKMNLEAQVVENSDEGKKKPTERKKPTATGEPKSKKPKKEKQPKDPNKPKRPPTAFFVFMNDFRKTFKEANPDSKGVTQVAKEGGEKWKSMSDEEKKPYQDKAAELKADFEKSLESNSAENEDDEGADQEQDKETEGADQEQDKEIEGADQEQDKETEGAEEQEAQDVSDEE